MPAHKKYPGLSESQVRALYRRNHRKEIAEYIATYRVKNQNQIRKQRHEYRIKFHYGMTKAEFSEKIKAQNNCCLICGDRMLRGKMGVHVDHHHVTNEVRGLLCGFCNVGLGYFKDSSVRLRAAADYLEKFK